MKHKVFLVATIMMALVIPREACAYDFSAVSPSGHTLYYHIVGSNVAVTSQNIYYPYYSTYPTGGLVIPASVTHNGTTYSVTMIEDWAFDGCSNLTSVSIPSSVTSIGHLAFYECSGLTSINIPNSIISIGNSAFGYCSSLTSVTIPNSVLSIGESAFQDCIGLTSVTISYSVTSIGEGAFLGCGGLTSIEVNSGNTVYDSRQNCNAIIETATNSLITGCMNTTIPSSIIHIGNAAFSFCSGLTSVNIPNSVASIGTHAFSYCSNLTTVIIPNSVTSIGDNAFYACSSLTEVTSFRAVAPTLGYDVFSGMSSTILVHIPCGSISSYQSSWNYFSNFLELVPEFTVNVQTQNAIMGSATMTIPPSCDSTAVIEATANYNYHFGYWSNGNTANPDTLHLVGDSMVMAYFIGLTVATSDIERGTATHNKIGERMERISATPNYGYHFDHWSNGSTANPDTIYLVGDSTVTAYFTGLTVLSSDSERGTASHIKIGDHLDRIIATANYGYHFDHWSNGSTANPDTIHLVGDSTVVAFFERNTYHLSAEVNDASLGSLSMPLGDSALYQDTLMVVASPIEHYHVGGWYGMDIVGISTNKDTVWVRMTNNCIVTCNFVINYYTVNVSSNDIVRGMVESNGTQFAYGTPCTVTATAYTGYTFYGWSNGVTANPYTFAVVGDVELTALFVAEGEDVYTVTVVSADPAMGSVSGGGQALSGGTVTIRAIPNEGYRFLNWQDGNTENPRTVTVANDLTYTAYFESTNQDVFNVYENKITVYPNPTSGRVKVAADDVIRIDVYNVNGQLVKTAFKESVIDISTLPSGIYTLNVETTQSKYVCRVIKG